ncbi:RhoGEF domain-containing protein [Melampsora americana]|nr:RhoGEF domain-containing protein [Melampsora americana]
MSRNRVRLASTVGGIRPKTAPLQITAALQINKTSSTSSSSTSSTTSKISKIPTVTHRVQSMRRPEGDVSKEFKLRHQSSLQPITNSNRTSNVLHRTIASKKSVSDLVAKIEREQQPNRSLGHQTKSIDFSTERNRKKSMKKMGESESESKWVESIEKDENEELSNAFEGLTQPSTTSTLTSTSSFTSPSSSTSDRRIDESQSHHDQSQSIITNHSFKSSSSQEQQQQHLNTNHNTNHNTNSNQNQNSHLSNEAFYPFSMAVPSSPSQSQQPLSQSSQHSQSSSLLNTSNQQTHPNPNHNSNRALRPRRSAASLHSIPERRSKELDQPPLPVPPTPWVEPATPNLNPPSRQASSSSNSVSDKSPHHSHSSFNIHPSHLLSPNDSNPDTDLVPLDSPLPWGTQDPTFPTTPPATTNTPGLRDQRLLSRYRATSQSVSTRHSEGSQYATSSSVWTPSSVAGSRLGFDSVDDGARTSVASRDSRFTAETDYEDYCQKVLQHSNPSASARSIHLAMSASWHGQQPEPIFNRPSSSPFIAQAVPLVPNPASEHLQRPTIVSLMDVEEQSEMVGLGITSDEAVSVSRNSRSPSLTGRLPESWRPSSQALNSSNKLSAPTSNPHTNASSSSSHTISSHDLESPRSRSVTPMMEPISSAPLSNISIKTHSLGVAVNPPHSSLASPSTPEGNSLSRAPSFHQKHHDADQEKPNPNSGFTDPTDASKARFYQHHHQAHWDDLDDGSPVLASSAAIPSKAVVLAEEGGQIVDFSTLKCRLEELHVPDDTTHLLITKTQGPFVLNSLLTSCLPRLTSTLVVLDISDSYLASLPSAIASCAALEELNISGNICASGDLPAWIAHLVYLKVLAADRCGLMQLVNPLGSLVHIHDLSLRSNHLKSLPSWLCHLQALEVLLVDDNEFEPPWLELAEPLLYYRSNESEATLPTASSASENGSLSSSLAHGAQHTRSAPAEVTSSSHFPMNISTTNDSPVFHGRVSRPTNGTADYPRASQTGSLRLSPAQNERRLEGVESLNRRNSSARRLRSSNDLRSTVARPNSYHDHSPSLASFMEAEDDHQSGLGPASIYTYPQIHPQADVHHSIRSAPLGPMERATFSILDRFPSKGIPQGVNFPPPQPPQSKEPKKSFGFLKKMSLGKLRREVTTVRERTNTLESRGGSAVPLTVYEVEPPIRPHVHPLMESPKAISEDAVMLMSHRESSAPSTRPQMPVTQSADAGGWGTHTTEREVGNSRRRSFLNIDPSVGIKKFEPLPMIPTTWTHSMSDAEGMVEDLMLATSINQDQNVNHHRASSESPSSQQHREPPSPVLRHGTPSHIPQTNRSSSIDPRTGLRSIMMYLRDVHDLSGEPAAPAGVNARPGPMSRASSTKQPSSKSVNHPDFHSLNGRNNSIAGMNVMASSLETDPELDISHSASIHQSQTCSPVLPSTNSVPVLPTETRPKVTDNPGRRLKVIEEIISTEKSYIRGLRELQDIYIANAVAMSTGGIGNNKEAAVPSSERKVVFNNVEAIIGFHVEVLLPDLQEVVDRLSKKQLTILAPNEMRSIAAMKKRKEQEAASAMGSTVNLRSDDSIDKTEENEEAFLERQRIEINGELIKAAAEELAKVFIRHAAFLKLYSTYITQFDLALERLREWTVTVSHTPTLTNHNGMSSGGASSSSSWAPGLNASSGIPPLTTNQKKKLKTYLKRCRANPSHSQMNLESYLLMPVQRLPRYKLLLENLQSCTPDRPIPPSDQPTPPPLSSTTIEDPSMMGLLPNQMVSEALSLISAVTAEMNERKRDSEGRQRLLYWQQRFGNKFRSPLVQPHRTLIKEGRVTLMRTVKLTTKDVVSSTGQNIRVRVSALSTDSQPVTMILLLCTDLLILAKDPGDGGSGSASSPASLHQALRLAQHTRQSLSLPATVFGAEQTMVRFVDSKAIFYFQCDNQRTASEWSVAVNQQVPLL